MEEEKKTFVTEECVVCLSEPPAHVFSPCYHCCCCANCANSVVEAKMACPLCRQVIVRKYEYLMPEAMEPVPLVEVAEFKLERRTEYVAALRAHHTKNALFVGKSKFSRSVGALAGSELELRQKETKGTERYGVGKKVTFQRLGDDGDTLAVTYKVGRRTINESYPFLTWEEARTQLVDGLRAEDETVSVLDLATHYPEYYWTWHYHKEGKVEATLQEEGIAPRKRGRRG